MKREAVCWRFCTKLESWRKKRLIRWKPTRPIRGQTATDWRLHCARSKLRSKWADSPVGGGNVPTLQKQRTNTPWRTDSSILSKRWPRLSRKPNLKSFSVEKIPAAPRINLEDFNTQLNLPLSSCLHPRLIQLPSPAITLPNTKPLPVPITYTCKGRSESDGSELKITFFHMLIVCYSEDYRNTGRRSETDVRWSSTVWFTADPGQMYSAINFLTLCLFYNS